MEMAKLYGNTILMPGDEEKLYEVLKQVAAGQEVTGH